MLFRSSFGHGNFDGYVLNLNKNGDTIWTNTYGEDKEDILYSIKHTPDSGFIFVGATMSFGASLHDFWLMRFDKNKNLLWKIPEPWITGPADDYGYCVTLNDSSQFVMAGATNGAGNGGMEISFVVMADYWNFRCSMSDGSTADDFARYAVQTLDKGYVMIGTTQGFGNGLINIYVLKIDPDCSKSSSTTQITGIEKIEKEPSNSFFGVYPNISSGKFSLKLNKINQEYKVVVCDIMGKQIYSNIISQNNSGEFQIDISNNAAGLYFITVSDKENFSCRKIIKQ